MPWALEVAWEVFVGLWRAADDDGPPPVVLHTRGAEQALLAELLSEGASEVVGNLPVAVVAARADLLVTSRLGSFDLVPVCAPADLELEHVDHVMAAVGTGPHSRLAADVAVRVSAQLGVEVELVAAAMPAEVSEAEQRLAGMAADRPGTLWRVASTADPTSVVEDAPEGTLLVLGAPGGNWFQRQMFGAGARLRAKTRGGSIVVRSSPRRVFHVAAPPELWLSPHLAAADAPALMPDRLAPVVEDGVLLGVISRDGLDGAEGTVGDHMVPAPMVTMTDEVTALRDVAGFFEDSPVPVVDGEGKLAAVAPARP